MTDPSIRASDADRHHVVSLLQRHVGTGRLTVDEFDQRARCAYQAGTLGELAALARDLPPEPVVEGPAEARHRRVPAAVIVALAVLSLLLGGAALANGTLPAIATPSAGMSCH